MIVFTNNNFDYKMGRISKNNVTNRHTVKHSSRRKNIKVTKSNKEFLRALGFQI